MFYIYFRPIYDFFFKYMKYILENKRGNLLHMSTVVIISRGCIVFCLYISQFQGMGGNSGSWSYHCLLHTTSGNSRRGLHACDTTDMLMDIPGENVNCRNCTPMAACISHSKDNCHSCLHWSLQNGEIIAR